MPALGQQRHVEERGEALSDFLGDVLARQRPIAFASTARMSRRGSSSAVVGQETAARVQSDTSVMDFVVAALRERLAKAGRRKRGAPTTS